MNKFGLIGKLNAKTGKGGELLDILSRAADLMRNAQGCRMYLVGHPMGEADAVQVMEIWDSKDDHDQSLAYPGVKELIQKAMPLLDGPPEKGLEWIVRGGHGLL